MICEEIMLASYNSCRYFEHEDRIMTNRIPTIRMLGVHACAVAGSSALAASAARVDTWVLKFV